MCHLLYLIFYIVAWYWSSQLKDGKIIIFNAITPKNFKKLCPSLVAIHDFKYPKRIFFCWSQNNIIIYMMCSSKHINFAQNYFCLVIIKSDVEDYIAGEGGRGCQPWYIQSLFFLVWSQVWFWIFFIITRSILCLLQSIKIIIIYLLLECLTQVPWF